MAPATTPHPLLSPAELSYLHTSLTQQPPIRPDGRLPTQFRPLIAESDVLPSTNGSARVCFADGTEAVVGVKAEVERAAPAAVALAAEQGTEDEDVGGGRNEWVELAIELPGYRDDDALPVFLSQMLVEALLAEPYLRDRLVINRRFHWKLYIDILLLSPPLSYPLPLLSLTTHLALLSTRLPRLVSERDEDPLFDDDWEAAIPLYPSTPSTGPKPPVMLLVMAVGANIIFDPTREELCVADAVLAVSVSSSSSTSKTTTSASTDELTLLAIRTIDPPSRLTAPGLNTATGGAGAQGATKAAAQEVSGAGVWRPPRGGVKRGVISLVVDMVVRKGGVGKEVLDGLQGVALS